jgi:hypothetical protein
MGSRGHSRDIEPHAVGHGSRHPPPQSEGVAGNEVSICTHHNSESPKSNTVHPVCKIEPQLSTLSDRHLPSNSSKWALKPFGWPPTTFFGPCYSGTLTSLQIALVDSLHSLCILSTHPKDSALTSGPSIKDSAVAAHRPPRGRTWC